MGATVACAGEATQMSLNDGAGQALKVTCTLDRVQERATYHVVSIHAPGRATAPGFIFTQVQALCK